MSRVCQVTGKKPMVGNNRSHAKNATRRRFLPNLQNHRFWLEEEKRFVQLRVSTKGIRIIDKKGIEVVVATGNDGYVNSIANPSCASDAIRVAGSTKEDELWVNSNVNNLTLVSRNIIFFYKYMCAEAFILGNF